MRTVEGFLSRRAQSAFPGALVYSEGGGDYVLEVPGQDPLGLGRNFGEAKSAIEALLSAKPLRVKFEVLMPDGTTKPLNEEER